MPLTATQRELVESHLPDAQKMASSFLRHVPRNADRDGIRGAANLGLCKAAARYDPAKNNNFAKYAASKIYGEMQDFCRAQAMLSPRRNPMVVLPSRQEMPGQIRDRREGPGERVERADDLRHLLRMVRRRDQRIVMAGIANGISPRDTARAIGVSPAMYFELRRQAIRKIALGMENGKRN